MQRQKPWLRLSCSIWSDLWKPFPSVPFFLGRLATVALDSTGALPTGPFGPVGNTFVLVALAGLVSVALGSTGALPSGPFGPDGNAFVLAVFSN